MCSLCFETGMKFTTGVTESGNVFGARGRGGGVAASSRCSGSRRSLTDTDMENPQGCSRLGGDTTKAAASGSGARGPGRAPPEGPESHGAGAGAPARPGLPYWLPGEPQRMTGARGLWENSFKCEVCEESFPTQAKLSVHQRSHFEPERPYQCAFSGCKKTFITVSALFSHNRAHFREQELFSCSFPGCSKQYDKACRLKIHLRSHTGERPFLCDFDGCGWNFTSMSKLLRHKRKHEDDRRFTCPVEGCGKSFTRAEHLKGHSITHLGTKPFVCPVEGCCARFSARSSLYIHSKKHLQDVDTWKSRCPVSTCNKLFTSKHSMKTHMAKRHNLGQDLLAQLEASNSLTPSSELTSQGQSDLSDADLVSLFSDVPGSGSAAMLDTALVNSGILTIDVASVSSTLAGNLPPNNSLGQAVDPRALMATSDLPQSLDTSLFFGTRPQVFSRAP
nr:zinc finger X-linked protein ZXDB-like [Loxodonta africana]